MVVTYQLVEEHSQSYDKYLFDITREQDIEMAGDFSYQWNIIGTWSGRGTYENYKLDIGSFDGDTAGYTLYISNSSYGEPEQYSGTSTIVYHDTEPGNPYVSLDVEDDDGSQNEVQIYKDRIFLNMNYDTVELLKN